MFIDEILDNWRGQPDGSGMSLASLGEGVDRAWTMRSGADVGVAIPLAYPEAVKERFAAVSLSDEELSSPDGTPIRCLTLMSPISDESRLHTFAALCAEFVTPGKQGELRRRITASPLEWWEDWKELLGNVNQNELVYDVVAELSVLDYLSDHGEDAEWNGPTNSTYDIDCDTRFVEVKSTSSRSGREITLSNRFQLIPPEGHSLSLVLCQMELASSGRSIDGLVEKLIAKGYSESDLEAKLALKGFESGMSARRKCFIIHTMSEYTIDDSFPAIRDDSFVGGKMPAFVKDITYTIDLDGVEYKALLADGDTADAV